MLVVIFFLGACVGSFINALVWRMATEKSIVFGRSQCTSCDALIAWYDLVPIASFFLLRGRCRACAKKISWQYPIVEVVMGALFVMTAIGAQFDVSLLLRWYFIASLAVIFLYDFRYRLIPLTVTLPATLIALISALVVQKQSILLYGGSLLIGAGFFGVQYVVSRGRWIGVGDLFLGLMMGAILGYPLILLALFLAYISGAMISLILLVMKKVTIKSCVPFGPFLCAATIVTMLYGEKLMAWYFSLL